LRALDKFIEGSPGCGGGVRLVGVKSSVADYETLVDDVRDLRAFALTSDLKSLTAAARLMGESKATLSRRITRLEAALGTALLRRSPRAIETTDEGAAYRVRVAQVLELLGDANAVAQGAVATPSGQLRVAAPPGFSESLAPVLAQFSAAFPKVAVSVHVGSRFVDLEAEQFDVALRATTKLADSSLVAHRMGSVEIERIVVAAPSYLKAHPAPRRVEDLESHRMLGHHEAAAGPTSVFTLHRNGEQVTISLPAAMASTDIALIRDVAVEGAGVSILPRVLVQRYLDDGRLVHLLPGVVGPGVSLYLLHRGGRFVPPKVRAFIDFVKKNLVLLPAKTTRSTRRP
jgi:DNA-binding transcriptional LysR family regulator